MKASGYGWASLGTLLGLLAIFACEKASQDAGDAPSDPKDAVLARVGDEVVTLEDLGFVPAWAKPSDRLETLVMRKLAAAEARRRGLEKEPQTREKLAQFRRNLATWEDGLLRNALYNSIRLGMTVSEEELRAHFEQTIDRYVEPQWKLRVRKFASEAEARAAAADLGATGRLDPAQSESIGPLSAGQLPPDLEPVLPLLKAPGDRQVLNLTGEWSLVELDTHLADAPLPFEVVRERVEQGLRAVRAEETLKAELAKLRAEQVTIEAAALATLEKEHAELAEKLKAERLAKWEADRAAAAEEPSEEP